MKTIEQLDVKIQELKNSTNPQKTLHLNLMNTSGDVSIISSFLTELRKNKIKLHVSASGNLSGAGIILLTAGRRGKRECSLGTTISLKGHNTDTNTYGVIDILKNIYKIDTVKLLGSLDSEENLTVNNINLFKLCDRIAYGGRRMKNPLLPKKTTSKTKTSNKNKDKKEQTEA